MEKQKDYVSPPQNEQYSPQWKNYEIPQCNRREIVADIHPFPTHIQIEHEASSSGDQASILIQGDDTLMEPNIVNNTMVKKPHAGSSGAAAGARPGAATAAASTTDVEQGKSLAESSSPLKQKLTSFTQGLTTKAKQVTDRLYKSPNKKCSKSEECDESDSEASTEKRKHLRRRRRRRKG